MAHPKIGFLVKNGVHLLSNFTEELIEECIVSNFKHDHNLGIYIFY
jgi:hypothetical protein